jgi:hypothetical protein
MPFQQRDIPIAEESQQTLGKLGTGAVLTGHHQLGVPVSRDTGQPQQDLQCRGVDCSGYMSTTEFNAAADIEDNRHLFGFYSPGQFLWLHVREFLLYVSGLPGHSPVL